MLAEIEPQFGSDSGDGITRMSQKLLDFARLSLTCQPQLPLNFQVRRMRNEENYLAIRIL